VKWLTDVLVHFGIARQLPTAEDRREAKHRRTIRKADRVLEDYRRQDGQLRIVVKKR
jgi:queuine/archaeosine tRNA-ribosyltransferase